MKDRMHDKIKQRVNAVYAYCLCLQALVCQLLFRTLNRLESREMEPNRCVHCSLLLNNAMQKKGCSYVAASNFILDKYGLFTLQARNRLCGHRSHRFCCWVVFSVVFSWAKNQYCICHRFLFIYFPISTRCPYSIFWFKIE